MKNLKPIILAVIAMILALLLICPYVYAAWDNDLPADISDWNDAAGEIRANNDALEAVFGVDLASGNPSGTSIAHTAFYGASFNAAVSAIGSTPTFLVFDTDQTLTSTISSIPATLTIMFVSDAKLAFNTFDVTTWSGVVIAPSTKQIFDYNSTGEIVVFAEGSQREVWPDWWGTGVTAVQDTIDAVSDANIPITLNSKTYSFSTGLKMTKSYLTIKGPVKIGGFPVGASGEGVGAVLNYTGTSGIAVELGSSPSTFDDLTTGTAPFPSTGGDSGNIFGIILENLFIRVTQNTDIGLRIWHTNSSIIRNVGIFGNDDNDGSNNVGLYFQGCQHTLLDNVEVKGQGFNSAGAANYLADGFFIGGGSGGTTNTGCTFYKLNARNCDEGIDITFEAVLRDITVENCNTFGIRFRKDFKGFVVGSHFEGNTTTGHLGGATVGDECQVVFRNCDLNIGTNKSMFIGDAAASASFYHNVFRSTHATPEIFRASDTMDGDFIFIANEFLGNSWTFSAGDDASLAVVDDNIWQITNVTRVDVNSAQLKALAASPVELVRAPGAGFLLEFISATLAYDSAATDYTVQADENLAIRYENGSGTIVSLTVEADSLIKEAASDGIRIVHPIATFQDTDVVGAVNKSLVLDNIGSGEYDDGTGVMRVITTYRIKKFLGL